MFTLVSHACPFLNPSRMQPGPQAKSCVLLLAGVSAGRQGVPSWGVWPSGCFAGQKLTPVSPRMDRGRHIPVCPAEDPLAAISS